MTLTSTAFSYGEKIPEQFTGDGQNMSPELSWTGASQQTESFVLVLHDPDAPQDNGFVHWVVYNIPPTVNHIAENVARDASVPELGMQGKNDGGEIGYAGPCPPRGTHHYFARLYALRAKLDLQPGAAYREVSMAMQGKVIEQAQLMGTYEKTRKAA
ncbi:MAG: YbhB/YbcL family Raf kinase inhibitor-like protein [Terriglobales bacterium]|jgi:Raf kinase inhibitor-like YbhB/YbcL family protein